MDSIEIIVDNEGMEITQNSLNVLENDTMGSNLSRTNKAKYVLKKRKSRSVICGSIHELELKVKEIKNNLPQMFSPKVGSCRKRNFKDMDKEKLEKYRKDKFERCYNRMEIRVLKPELNLNKNRQMNRNIDYREDCKKLAKLLSKSKYKTMSPEFHKILKLHSAFPAFSYYDADLQNPENLNLIHSFINLKESDIPQNQIYYKGEMQDQEPEGRGVMLTTSSIYEGYFSKGFKQGLGRSISIKKYYTGYWFQDKYSGFGTLVKKSSIYSGEFEFGKESGFGIMKTRISRYEGQWKLAKQHGFGVLKFDHKWVYKGEFCDGEFRGSGTLIWKNGKRISGTWQDGKLVGVGEKSYVENEDLPDFSLDEGGVYSKEQSLMKIEL